MEERNINELITALVDNELTEAEDKVPLLSFIKDNPQYSYNYQIQLLTKNLVIKHKNFVPAPEKLKRKINRKIKPGLPVYQKIFGNLVDLNPPVYAYAAVAIILVGSLFWFTTFMSSNHSNIEKRNNFFLAAQNNFYSILDGKINPDIITSQPETLKTFFIKHGIEYNTQIPCFKDWTLLGGVVSTSNGEKYAHMLYSNKEGKFIYVFQVCEHYLNNSNSLFVTEELKQSIQKAKYFCEKNEKATTYLTKHEGNLFAIVTNDGKHNADNLLAELN